MVEILQKDVNYKILNGITDALKTFTLKPLINPLLGCLPLLSKEGKREH